MGLSNPLRASCAGPRGDAAPARGSRSVVDDDGGEVEPEILLAKVVQSGWWQT